jgi:hypothetical protein
MTFSAAGKFVQRIAPESNEHEAYTQLQSLADMLTDFDMKHDD